MNEQEIIVIDKLRDAWNEFKKLPKYHEADEADFVHAIHAAQNIVMSRTAVRVTPKVFPIPAKL